MILYHGTNISFDEVDLLKGLPGKDFGRGFYKLSLQFRLFDKGLISLDAFVDGLQFKQLYMQYSFHTAEAVSILKYEGDEKV